MKNHFIIRRVGHVTIVLALLFVSCTAEDIRNAIDQIKTDEQEAIVPGDGTTLSGSYALDDGSGLTNTYLSFTNGKMYEYTCSSTAILAEEYLWNASSKDFFLKNSGECSVSDGILYRDGVPCGRLRVSDSTIVLDDVVYRKFSGFKSGRYTIITIEGDATFQINYQKQDVLIPVSLSKTIPAGVLTAKSDADWLVPGIFQNGNYILHAAMNDVSFYDYGTRWATVSFSYPGAEDFMVKVKQSGHNTYIILQNKVQNVSNSGGSYDFSYSINDPHEGVAVDASTKTDWISNVVVRDNHVMYNVSPMPNNILAREGVIDLTYGKVTTTNIFICQRGPVDSSLANCYIVSSPGTYRIKTVYGNSTKIIDGISSAEVLWESYGTSTTPSVGSVINNVSYSNNTIFFSTPTSLKNGNAVIAAKDASGKILWSWHIWVCSGYNPATTAQTYFNNAGVMMDRNLGATSAEPGDVGALGLLYQWGRKDPFLGSSGISSSTKAASTLSWPSPIRSDSSTGTVAYAVAHPTTFITQNTNNFDWYYSSSSSTDYTRWQSAKTIYDPCPPGWRVPDGGLSGVWYKAVGSSSFSYTWDSTNKGMNFSGKFGSASASISIIWYPAAGFLDNGGRFFSVGYSGYWWSCNNYDCLSLDDDGNVHPSYFFIWASGLSVRCLQE